jgi:hypothetical protein
VEDLGELEVWLNAVKRRAQIFLLRYAPIGMNATRFTLLPPEAFTRQAMVTTQAVVKGLLAVAAVLTHTVSVI